MIAVVAGSIPFAVDYWSIDKETRTENMSAVVINASGVENASDLQLGINTERNFDYGEIPDSVAVRKSLVFNSTKDVLVQMSVSGNISEKVDYQETYYFNGSKEIPVEFNSTEPGYFTGKLDVTTSMPANSVGERWLDLKYSLYS